MLEQSHHFKIAGTPIFCAKYGNGHINATYLVVDSVAREYILQKINKKVFKNPDMLMKNISAVTEHLKKTASTWREVLTLIPAEDGSSHYIDTEGEYWRMYAFVSDSMCFDQSDENTFRESGIAFGLFQRRLSDFPANTLTETIPQFHDTPNRYMKLHAAIKEDCAGRAKSVQKEIEFALSYEGYAGTLMNLQKSGDLPLRVTHNDTKLNNVLFDRETHKAVCVIDLDTVMPGLAANDFGDSIRFGASTAAEDEMDLEKVSLSLDLFKAYSDGFLSSCGKSLTPCEINHLCDGAKMMTLENGVRFLTDYLAGDVYFKTSKEYHNLDRCRTQFKLVDDMDKKWDNMQQVIKGCIKERC